MDKRQEEDDELSEQLEELRCRGCVHIIGSNNFLRLSKACAEFIADLENNKGRNSAMLLENIKEHMSRMYIMERKDESKN